jgi:hypothetical protein
MIITTNQSRGFTRTKEQKEPQSVVLTPDVNSVVPAGAQNVQVTNINIVSQPSYPSAFWDPWEVTYGELSTSPECLDANGNQKHANPTVEVAGSTTHSTSENLIAGGGGTEDVTFTYDVEWQAMDTLNGVPTLVNFSSVGIQEQDSVTVDLKVTTESITKTYRGFSSVTCY